MILSLVQERSIERECQRFGIEGQADELVRDALNAIVTGKADEAAYRVAEAAGVGFIGKAIWYREEFHMNAEQARTLLTQAKKDQVYEGPVPEDDAKAISEANSLVEMADQAWEQYVRGPEVEQIRILAQSFASENGDGPSDEGDDDIPQEDQVPPHDPETGEVLDDSEGEEEEEKAPEQPQGDPELASVEPWEGYNTEKLSSIYEALEAGMEAEDEDPRELLAHVWAFETAHKNRIRILNRLQEYAKRLEGGDGEEEQQQAPPEEKPPSAPPQPDDEAGEEPQHEDPPADAKPQPKPKAPESRQENRPRDDEAKSPSQDGEGDDAGLMEDVDEEIRRERLHIPDRLPEERPEMPDDLITISAQQLQQLYMAFSAYAYRANYLLVRQETAERKCKAAVTELTQALIAKAEKYDEHGKQKTMTILEAEVAQDENVKNWTRRQRKHEQFAHFYRSERDAYQRYVESLSRLETMRHNEWERSR
jgi:hypothetical protein